MAKQASLFSFFNKSNSTLKSIDNSPCTIKIKGVDVTELTLVWAKMDGHPWWPGIVCYPPSGTSFVRKKSLHLQFFEDPPSRGWVRESMVKPYGDPMKVGVAVRKDSQWRTARAKADDAHMKNLEDRRDLLVDHAESDEEMEDGNSSKENMDDSNMSATSPVSKKRANSAASDVEPSKKKRRIVLKDESDESADDYKPNKDGSSSEDESASSGEDEVDQSKDAAPQSSEDEMESPSPLKEKKKAPCKRPLVSGGSNNTPYTPSAPPFTPYTPTAPAYTPNTGASPALKSKLALFAAKEQPNDSSQESHASHPFLLPENIRDKHGHRPSHPDYSPRTVRLPDDFLCQQTPGHRQWWVFKADHYDTVLFFKMGKFYELFYMDADIGVQELGLIMMKGNTPHSGFPEISYGRYSASLIDKGYKVARIEQTETPDMMEKRCKTLRKPTKFDRVVRREVCQLSSAGTRVWGVQDAQPTATDPANLLAITAKAAGDVLSFGVAFVDTSLGTFHIGQFTDDRHNSRLRTLLAHHPPVQVVYEKGRLVGNARQLVGSCVSDRLIEALVPGAEYWTAEKTITFLQEDDCFRAKDGSVDWPLVLKEAMEEGGSCSALEGKSDLSFSSLGALVWYLKHSNLHSQILTRRLFKTYVPPDSQPDASNEGDEETPSEEEKKKVVFRQRTMVIDGGSATNLELLQNSSSGDAAGSLLGTLDSTKSPMGKRLLVSWISSPLVSCDAINCRLDAVQELRDLTGQSQEVRKVLDNLPDIDRLLPRIHSQGLKFSASDPNSRAILYEEQKYSKSRVNCFLTAIQAFKHATSIPSIFKDMSLQSSLLKDVVTMSGDGGRYPDMTDKLRFFEKAFDHAKAKSEGKIVPCRGVDTQYDQALDDIDSTKSDLEDNLKEEARHFKAKVVYFGSDKRRYQLEVPESASRLASGDYELVSQRKGFKRFLTSRCKELLVQMTAAEQAREVALRDIARRIFQQFDEEQELWSRCVECVSLLDVLLSLAQYSNTAETVRPVIHHPAQGQEPFLEIREGVHPCIGVTLTDIIPNDVVIGCDGGEGAHSPLVLVTGPNMGGKSTLMRQAALLTIMAQMGSFVPCNSMRLSPVDRIFTRVGASDRMMAGESTFLLELRETAAILQHATQHALVLIDELGRGTATHDGTAVAWGVAGALIERGCRTLFSTHYHALVHHFAHTPGVSMGHMACMVEGDDDLETGGEESITFLYKFIAGVCPKSYGFNAARLAEIPPAVVQSGRRAARLMEGRVDALAAFKKLFIAGASVQDKRDVLKNLAPILKAVAV